MKMFEDVTAKAKHLVKDMLKANDLFGICCVDEDDSFTRFERIVELCSFVAMQIITVSFLADVIINNSAACACIDGDPVGNPAQNDCTSVGDTTFSLPADGSWRQEWFDYESAHLPPQCLDSPLPPSENATVFCDSVYACCYAYLDHLIEEGEWLTYPTNYVDPCPYDPITEAILASIFGTFLSLFLFKPLVKFILMLETQVFNCIAYILVTVQIILALSYFSDYVAHASQLYIPESEIKTLGVMGKSIMMGLCIWSPISFFVMRFLCCCCCCCCCHRGDTAAAKEEEDLLAPEQELLGEGKGTEPGYGSITRSDRRVGRMLRNSFQIN